MSFTPETADRVGMAAADIPVMVNGKPAVIDNQTGTVYGVVGKPGGGKPNKTAPIGAAVLTPSGTWQVTLNAHHGTPQQVVTAVVPGAPGRTPEQAAASSPPVGPFDAEHPYVPLSPAPPAAPSDPTPAAALPGWTGSGADGSVFPRSADGTPAVPGTPGAGAPAAPDAPAVPGASGSVFPRNPDGTPAVPGTPGASAAPMPGPPGQFSVAPDGTQTWVPAPNAGRTNPLPAPRPVVDPNNDPGNAFSGAVSNAPASEGLPNQVTQPNLRPGMSATKFDYGIGEALAHNTDQNAYDDQGKLIKKAPTLAKTGEAAQTYGADGSVGYDPFNTGTPITLSGGDSRGHSWNAPDWQHFTVHDLQQYLYSLNPAQTAQVQQEMLQAGYFGNDPVKAAHTLALGTWDDSPLMQAGTGRLFNAVIDAAAQGRDLGEYLAADQHAFSSQLQKSATSAKTPVVEDAAQQVVNHVDPSTALAIVDKTSLAELGYVLPDAERQAWAAKVDDLYTSKQKEVNAGRQTQANLNAETRADAAAFTRSNPDGSQTYIGGTGEGFVQAAQQELGTPYVHGGNGRADGGFDCSSLVQTALKKNGISVPRTSEEQFADPGGQMVGTDPSQAQVGDLVFFRTGAGSGVNHVGIYIGNGMMIDAPHTGSNVRIEGIQGFGNIAGFKRYSSSGPSQGGQGGQSQESFMSALRQQESGGNYSATNSIGASGAYQFMQGTWSSAAKDAGYGQFANGPASAAPKEVQDAVASKAIAGLYKQFGNWGDVAKAWYAGPGFANTDQAAAQSGGPSINDYASQVLAKMGNGAVTLSSTPGSAISQQVTPSTAGQQTGVSPTITDGSGTATVGTGDTVGGRQVIGAPVVKTDTVNYDTSVDGQNQLGDDLGAQMRSAYAAPHEAHSLTNIYGMLTKTLRAATAVTNN